MHAFSFLPVQLHINAHEYEHVPENERGQPGVPDGTFAAVVENYLLCVLEEEDKNGFLSHLIASSI